MLVETLESPTPATMLCRTLANCSGETCRTVGKTRPNMLVLSKLTKLWQYDWKVCCTGIMKITLLLKELPFSSTQVHSDASSIFLPDAKAAVEKELENEKILASWIRSIRIRVLRNLTMKSSEKRHFTIVHSGARRTSGPETRLSFSWRKFIVSPVLFRTRKNGRDPYTNLVRVQ